MTDQPVGLPDTDRRWTLSRKHPMTTMLDQVSGERLALGEVVEVVPASALAVEREGREQAEKERDEAVRGIDTYVEALAVARGVALGVAADLRKWADPRLPIMREDDFVSVHRAKLLSRAARLEGEEE